MIVLHSASSRVVGLALWAATLLAACQQVPMLPGLSTYRIDIQQGNVVTQEMVDKLKPGMTRQQVRFVLGTPPVVDPFRQDRWDYVYYYNKNGKLTEHRRLVLLFNGDVLKRIEGDVTPAAGQPTAGAAASTPSAPPPPAAAAKPTPSVEQPRPVAAQPTPATPPPPSEPTAQP